MPKSKPKPTIEIKNELLIGIKELVSNNSEIRFLSLCTTDGFYIKAYADKALSVEPDKIAAMTSTLCSLSNSTAQQIIQEEFTTATVETDGGLMIFMSAEYLKISCVLSIAVKASMSLATARFLTKRLADNIANIT